ncbi:hypothetical protein [Kineosporia succinea]|uniref:Uncharacterized protein n=1 Tax=Kineosporia succinea TaxID=84632 RepID=A0ABT9P5T6_9ACTN|nr:hypothetical protein [Kineosporia succinea]MDP9828056.1 hypothetical protein [Kineosporia succinea]
MTGHELAKLLLSLPDLEVQQGEWDIAGAYHLQFTHIPDVIELEAR